MVTSDLVGIIEQYSAKYAIPENIIYGVCMQESNFQMMACRYEPGYKWLYHPETTKPKGCSMETEKVFQKVSWGIGQCMGAVLREYGYTDWLPSILFDKHAQIMYCVKHLANLKKRFPEGNDYISAYNQGSPRKRPNGEYVNSKYVNSVMAFSKGWKV